MRCPLTEGKFDGPGSRILSRNRLMRQLEAPNATTHIILPPATATGMTCKALGSDLCLSRAAVLALCVGVGAGHLRASLAHLAGRPRRPGGSLRTRVLISFLHSVAEFRLPAHDARRVASEHART